MDPQKCRLLIFDKQPEAIQQAFSTNRWNWASIHEKKMIVQLNSIPSTKLTQMYYRSKCKMKNYKTFRRNNREKSFWPGIRQKKKKFLNMTPEVKYIRKIDTLDLIQMKTSAIRHC